MRREDCAECGEIIAAYNAAARARRNVTAMRALARYDSHFVEKHRQDPRTGEASMIPFFTTDLAIHQHPITREIDESGAVIFRCTADCSWWWWLAPVSAPTPILPRGVGGDDRPTDAEKAAGRVGVVKARRVLAAAFLSKQTGFRIPPKALVYQDEAS